MTRSRLLAVAGAILAAACAPSGPKTKNAQLLAAPMDSCVLARDEAALDPRLEVDKVPAPVKMDPAPIRRPVPRGVLNRNGSSVVRVEVLVDTLGKPDMTTFAVLEASNAWFVTGARNAIAKWTFTPAERYGCKVPRYYVFAASSPARTSP
ncbi:MAG: hypothetical protein OEW77_05315 [Gemmatimonadota bacterium]|nr:hypothetical protein [Gemmatimonadota bacterium]